MKKFLLSVFLAVITAASGMAQNHLYRFPFDGSLSATVGEGTFPSGGTSYTTDRHGNTGKAIAIANSNGTHASINVPLGGNSRTISIWFKRVGGITNNSALFAYGELNENNQFKVYFAPTGALVFHGGSSNYMFQLNSPVSHDTWHHLVVTYSAGTLKMYLNGSLKNTHQTTLNTTNSIFRLGDSFDGHLDDLNIYDYALNDTQVSDLFNGVPDTSEDSNNQQLLYDFSFNASLSSTVGTGTFTGTGTSYTTDRDGNTNKALAVQNRNGITATLDLPSGNNSRTIALWFKRVGTSDQYSELFSYGNKANNTFFAMMFNESGGLRFDNGDSNSTRSLSASVPHNTWHHLVVIYDKTNIKLYFNGELKNTFQVALNTTDGSSFRIGKNIEAHYDDLKFYNYALKTKEVEDLYNPSTNSTETPSIRYHFKFDRTYSATVGQGTFSAGGNTTSFIADRKGNANKAIKVLYQEGITAIINSPEGDTPRTVALWFKRVGGVDNSPELFAYGRQTSNERFAMRFDVVGNLYFDEGPNNGQLRLSAQVPHNTWHHLVVTYADDELKFYLNGELKNTYSKVLNTVDRSMFTLAKDCEIHIDELYIYNNALNQTEVTNLYNGTNTTEPEPEETPGLLYDFPFNGSLSAKVGTGTFENTGTSFTTDRDSNAGKALAKTQNNGITAPLTIPTGSEPRTIAVWFKRIGGADNSPHIFSYGDQKSNELFAMTFTNKGGLYFNSGNGSGQSLSSSVSWNTWLHIAVTYAANKVKLYLNGELKNEYTAYLNTSNASSFRLGYNLDAHFDDLKIYNYALSASEITQVYNQKDATEAVINIPDANFKAAILAHSPAIDTNGDGKIQISEATAFTGHINVSGKNISNITGIEAFINATVLNCSNNPITTLDLSKNAALTQLFCNDAQLTKLNVANGNNTGFIQINALNNPNLTCVQVDNAAYSTANWLAQPFQFDTRVGFSENCAVSTGIDNVKDNNITTVYPNPVRYKLNIVVRETANIKIVNLAGVVVANHQLNAGNNTIDVSTLTKGVYFILPSNDGGLTNSATVVKFIKE